MFDKIFISYAKEDLIFADKLYDFLENYGYKPWLDKRKLLPGQLWKLEIQKALKDANYVILLLSEISVQKRGYVQREFKYALEYFEEKLEDDIYLIPLKINNCEVPESLSKFQWIEFEDTETFEQILQSLKIQQEKYLSYERKKNGCNEKYEIEEYTHEEKIKGKFLTGKITTAKINFKDTTNNSLIEINNIINGEISEYIVNSRRTIFDYDFENATEAELNNWSFDTSISSNFTNSKIASLIQNFFEYTGGAHGNYGVVGLNFYLNPTIKIELQSLFEYEDQEIILKFISNYCLEDICRNHIEDESEIKKYKTSNKSSLFENSLDSNWENFDNFLISKKSIDIIFNPYQILPYAFGAPIVSIPIEKILEKIQFKSKIEKLISALDS